MRIAIDMQGMQSISKNRGIGRYTKSLVRAIVRNRGEHEIYLVLNGLFMESVIEIREQYEAIISDANIKVWYPSGDVSFAGNNAWRRRTAELTREAFISSLEADVILVTSLFEGVSDSATLSIGQLSRSVPTAVIVYDLIPLIHRKIYLVGSVLSDWYEDCLDNIRRADLLLSISESSRQEAIEYLDFNNDSVVNISSAIEDTFAPISVDKLTKGDIFHRYGINAPYIMYTGGHDFRKNIDGLICAYASLPKELRIKYQLVIVCELGNATHELLELGKKLGLQENELVFTGFVSDKDLLILYNLCYCFVFPSWHEGFGLPVLEAMACGRAVIGSAATSIPEVICNDDALFDPHSTLSIATVLSRVLLDNDLRGKLEKHGLMQAKKFSWDMSAKKAIISMEKLEKKCSGRNARKSGVTFQELMTAIVEIVPTTTCESEWINLAQALSLTFPNATSDEGA